MRKASFYWTIIQKFYRKIDKEILDTEKFETEWKTWKKL